MNEIPICRIGASSSYHVWYPTAPLTPITVSASPLLTLDEGDKTTAERRSLTMYIKPICQQGEEDAPKSRKSKSNNTVESAMNNATEPFILRPENGTTLRFVASCCAAFKSRILRRSATFKQ